MAALREYQTKCINMCRKAYVDGRRRIMVALPTGSGKTVIFTEQARAALNKGLRVMVIVRRKSIVMQTVQRMQGDLKLTVGRFMSSYTEHLDSRCVVSSIDTLARRSKREDVQRYVCGFDLVIVDEAHDTTSDSYQKVLNFMATSIKKPTFIGYTATPYRIGNKGHEWWDCCVIPTYGVDLMNSGHLAPLDIYAPTTINTDKINFVGSDFQNKQLFERVNVNKIYGNIISSYERIAKGKSAIVFCVNKKHSKMVCERFKEAGYESEHCDCGTTVEERAKVINFMQKCIEKKKPFILCNVNIFSTGIDIPEVSVAIQARPTASKVLYIQQVGRILRPHPTKDKAILIDHGGNCRRFGSPYEKRDPEMVSQRGQIRKEANKVVGHRCPACSFFSAVRPARCPSCGRDHEQAQKTPQESADELSIINSVEPDHNVKKVDSYYKNALYRIKQNLLNKNQNPDYAYYILYEKEGPHFVDFLRGHGCPDVIMGAILRMHRPKPRGRVNEIPKPYHGKIYCA